MPQYLFATYLPDDYDPSVESEETRATVEVRPIFFRPPPKVTKG